MAFILSIGSSFTDHRVCAVGSDKVLCLNNFLLSSLLDHSLDMIVELLVRLEFRIPMDCGTFRLQQIRKDRFRLVLGQQCQLRERRAFVDGIDAANL